MQFLGFTLMPPFKVPQLTSQTRLTKTHRLCLPEILGAEAISPLQIAVILAPKYPPIVASLPNMLKSLGYALGTSVRMSAPAASRANDAGVAVYAV